MGGTIMSKNSFSSLMAPIVGLVLLAGIAIDYALFHQPTGDANPYHERVRTVAETMPYTIGNWIGTDVEVPPAAIALLRPNVLLNRRFRNVKTDQQVSMLLVQCGDSRDLVGHYPPVCYVAHGWTQLSAAPRNWQVGDLAIHGTEYQFERSTFEQTSRIIIDNFMVLPDGTIARDVEAMRPLAENPRRKIFGAAQVQIVFQANTPVDQRDEIVNIFLAANAPIISTIRSGINHD